jgi:hypothetical protein
MGAAADGEPCLNVLAWPINPDEYVGLLLQRELVVLSERTTT